MHSIAFCDQNCVVLLFKTKQFTSTMSSPAALVAVYQVPCLYCDLCLWDLYLLCQVENSCKLSLPDCI